MIEQFELSQPPWVSAEIEALPEALPDVHDRMRAVINFARINIEQETGGPFAAGVFETASGKLVSLGVNRVLAHHCSSAHAEVMALSLAQQQLRHFDLGAAHLPAHQLVVNWRPCAMCYGALIWSGVTSLVIAGDGPELEQITGFDEGPIHPQWRQQLDIRGIEVVSDILTEDAVSVFEQFRDSDLLVYNGRAGD